MKLRVRILHSSAELYDSLVQMEAIFGNSLSVEGVHLAVRDDVSEIVVGPIATHPAMSRTQRASASLSRATKTYFVKCLLSYVEFVSADWSVRVNAFRESMAVGVRALPMSRFSNADKGTLLEVVERAASRTVAARPEVVAPAKPVFVRVDDEGKPTGLALQIDGPVPRGPGFLIEPQDAGKHEGLCDWKQKSKAAPFRMFKRELAGQLAYAEAWYADGTVIEHWGTCGDNGETRNHAAASDEEAHRTLERLKKTARAGGYRPIPNSRMKMLIVEYVLDSWGSPEDLDQRHRMEDAFNDMIGWLGLGYLDGGSIGSGSMEISLMVVDFEIAKAAIERATKGTEMEGFSRIYLAGKE